MHEIPIPRPVLSLEAVSKRYASIWAVRDVSLVIEPGDFAVLFGPNGAGKTTLLKILAWLVRPSQGLRNGSLSRAQIGYVSHQTLLYDALTALENLCFFARLYGHPDPEGRSRELINQLSLNGHEKRRVSLYSRGMKQRLSLARALLNEPDLVLMDEPYTGLDPQGVRLLTDLLAWFKDIGKTVFLVTHNLRAGLSLANHVLIQNQGRIVYSNRESVPRLEEFERIYHDVTTAAPKTS